MVIYCGGNRRFESKEECKEQESIRSNAHMTRDTTCESDKHTRKRHIQETQEISPFPASDNKAARNGQDMMIDKHETQITKRHRLGKVRKKITGGFKHV